MVMKLQLPKRVGNSLNSWMQILESQDELCSMQSGRHPAYIYISQYITRPIWGMVFAGYINLPTA
jgi:hypothetical protein